MSVDASRAGGHGPTGRELRELQNRLSAVRAAAVESWPYMQAALFRLCPRWDYRVPTVGVDGAWRLYIGPKFFAATPIGELAVVLVGHELQHALLDHAERLTQYRGMMLESGGRLIPLANVAHDLAINAVLDEYVRCGKEYQDRVARKIRVAVQVGTAYDLAVPGGALRAQNFKDKDGQPFPLGMTSEVYAALLAALPPSGKGARGGAAGGGKGGSKDQSPAPGDGPPGDPGKEPCHRCGSGAGDHGAPWEDPTDPDPNDPDSGVTAGERDAIGRQVARAIEEHTAKQIGSVPGHLRQWAKIRLEPPKVPWQRELAAVVRSAANWAAGLADYTYTRRNRRQAGDVILAGFRKPVPPVVNVLDTSGSMSSNDYKNAFSELAGLYKAIGLPRMPVIACDAGAHAVQWISRLDQLETVGGGGTDMPVGIRAAVREKARVVVVLTDGYTRWDMDHPPGVRVIACITTPKGKAATPPDWIRTVYCGAGK